ncbi:DNA-dependent RNA polymerase domain-containing protein [Ditylenchus destructor]|nr:DNA-dependent RNA polymerase domain-containing protein [Ditylenchus destructor]
MNVILRDRFVALNKQEIINQLSESLLRSHVKPIENDIERFGCPDLSNDRERIEDGIEELKKPFVIDQKYLSGDLDIEKVRESVYFFS